MTHTGCEEAIGRLLGQNDALRSENRILREDLARARAHDSAVVDSREVASGIINDLRASLVTAKLRLAEVSVWCERNHAPRIADLEKQAAELQAANTRVGAKASGEAGTWIAVEDSMPASNVPVLAFFVNAAGQPRRVRAQFAAPRTLRCDEECCDGGEYDEAEGTSWALPGWYEDNSEEETHWWISSTVTHWMPMPPAPSAPPQPATPEGSEETDDFGRCVCINQFGETCGFGRAIHADFDHEFVNAPGEA